MIWGDWAILTLSGFPDIVVIHIIVPAITGTLGALVVLIAIWAFLYAILIGIGPVPETVREEVRVNLATLRGITGIGIFFDSILNRLEERERIQTKRQQRKEAERLINDYLKILERNFGIQIPSSEYDRKQIYSKIIETTEQTKTGAYPIITETLLSEYSQEVQHSVEALTFAREIERLKETKTRRDATGEQISDFTGGVRNALDIFNFREPGAEEETFLRIYEAYGRPFGEFPNQLEETETKEFLQISSSLSREQMVELYQDFMVRYYPSESWVRFAENEYIEYKNKIVELVQAQISIGGVQGDIFGLLQGERRRIREQLEAQEAYIVCSKQIAQYDQSFQYELLPEKYPRSIRIGNKYIQEPGQDEENLEIKMRIVFPQKSYGSADNFLENSLSDVVPREELVYVSKLSMPFYHDRSEEEYYETADDSDVVNYVLSKTDFLLRGRSDEEITRAAIDNLRMSEMNVAELLKSLTLRSVVDRATYEEEQFFSENRSRIEEGLDIHDIFEWGEQDPDVIGELLRRWDEEEVSERWDSLMTEYISQIEKATPPDFVTDGNYGI